MCSDVFFHAVNTIASAAPGGERLSAREMLAQLTGPSAGCVFRRFWR